MNAKILNMKNKQYYKDIVENYREIEKSNILLNRNNIILKDINDIDLLVDDAFNHMGLNKVIHYGVLKKEIIKKIKSSISNYPNNGWKLNKNKYELAIRVDTFLHLVNNKKCLSKNDVKLFIKELPNIVTNFDSVEYTKNEKNEGLRFTKKINKKTYISFLLTSEKKNRLLAKSIALKYKDTKKRNISPKTNDTIP